MAALVTGGSGVLDSEGEESSGGGLRDISLEAMLGTLSLGDCSGMRAEILVGLLGGRDLTSFSFWHLASKYVARHWSMIARVRSIERGRTAL